MSEDLGMINQLYFGDNLSIMKEYIEDESVDLIYLDPPFNSSATYNMLFKEKDGAKSAAQITAFDDTWHWGLEANEAFYELVTSKEITHASGKLPALVNAMIEFLGRNDMMAYLVMMAVRLVELRRVLKPTGTIYLHCDPRASHYLKQVMDAIFGADKFANEVIWKRTSAKGLAFKRFASDHDVILCYQKSNDSKWNPQYMEHDPEYLRKFYRFVEPETGRRYRLDNLANPNKDRPNLTYEFLGVTRVWRWTKERMQKAYEEGLVIQSKPGGVPALKRYLDEQEGTPVDDVWTDIKPVQSQAAERLGYPTQKPEALLERIIAASSDEGDLVLDPFCGCGTTISVAERLHRRWIGIDITHLAITLMVKRLEDTFGSDLAYYEIHGDPKDLESARALAEENRHQFEWWALSLVDASPAHDKKKGPDRGIDGNIYFFDDESGKAKKIVVQVKSGHVTRNQIGDLKGVMDREKSPMGAFITLAPPTREMNKEALSSGYYEPEHFPDKKYPKVQILTIEELLAGKQLKYPRLARESTFKKAEPKKKAKKSTEGHAEPMFENGLLGEDEKNNGARQ